MVVLTSFTQPTDGIRHRQQNTVVYVDNNNLGKGTLYIAESRLSWIGESGNGFSIEYPHIALHAISRDLSAFPQECLFLMLDTPLADDDDQNNEEEEDAEGDESNKQGTTEMRLVPDDRGMLDAMFHAMNECQALHPDPEDSFSDEDFFEDADDESPMEEADSQMARLRIGNMDGRAHMEELVEDMVGGRVGGMRECMALGMGEDRAGGRVADIRESMALGILGGMGADRVGGMGADRVGGRVGDTRENMALDILGDMEEGMEVGTEGDMEEGTLHILGGREGDMEGDREEGTLHILEGREGDREGGMEGDREGDREEGTSHISGGREEGTVEGTSHISGGREEGMGAGRGVGRGVGMELGISRGDRSLFLGNMSHPDSSAWLPLAHSPHTVVDSHFDDAES